MSGTRKRKSTAQNDVLADIPRARKHTKHTHTSTASISASAAPKLQKAIQRPTRAIRETDITSTQKRKRVVDDETIQVSSKTSGCSKRSKTEDVTPQSKRFRNALPPSPAGTPSKKAALLFDRLDLRTPNLEPVRTIAYDTPPTSPESLHEGFADVLPPPLVDLSRLFAAFLSAINEQSALSRADFRINIKELLETTTKIWNKRAVNLDDLCRLLALVKQQDLHWSLEDYGKAGLCLIRSQASRSTSIIDTIKLKRAFEKELQQRWAQWQRVHAQDVDGFMAQLPFQTIKKSDAVDKAASIFSRGKDRLRSLKKSQSAAQTAEIEAKRTVDTTQATAQTRGSNLLDRILAKQLVNSSIPAGPTKEQLERKSSLQRVEEIARILEVLSAGRARASFSMPSVVQQLQQSLRTPISRIEAERCVGIIAAEIMPQFVSIISSGTVNGIVITRAGKLGLADLKQKLADADN